MENDGGSTERLNGMVFLHFVPVMIYIAYIFLCTKMKGNVCVGIALQAV
jgi:hypothetical protein